MAEEASGLPGAVDSVVEVVGDVAVVQLVMVSNEAEFAQLAVKLTQPVDVDSGGPMGWEGTRGTMGRSSKVGVRP